MDEVDKLANVLWEYMLLHEKVEKSDAIIAMGCEDVRVAERAADLYLDGYGKWLTCTGKSGSTSKEILLQVGYETEAAYFAAIAQNRGVDSERILIENQSTNTGDNIAFIKRMLSKKQHQFARIIVVTKPYAERRIKATYDKQWPEQRVIVTSPQINYLAYPNEHLSKTHLIHMLVGRLDRIRVYAETGYQTKVEIPQNVLAAYEKLISLGYDEQLVRS